MPEFPPFDEECFFIGPIGDEGSVERTRSDLVLKFIVDKAATELGLTAVRADAISTPGQITHQIIDHVLQAKAAVVDLTGLNANVMYELAVRHTARLPIALIAETDSTLPFDVIQQRTIFVDHTNLQSADDCRQQIVKHLTSALEGAVDSPIATSIDLQALSAGNAVERNLADLITTMEDMARSQSEMAHDLQRLGDSRLGRLDAEARDLIHAALVDIRELEQALDLPDEEEISNLDVQVVHHRLVEIQNRLLRATRWQRRAAPMQSGRGPNPGHAVTDPAQRASRAWRVAAEDIADPKLPGTRQAPSPPPE